MTEQVQDQQQLRRQRRKRQTLLSVAILLLVGIAAIWIANVGNILSGTFGIIFTLLGIILTLLQWQPHSQPKPQTLAKAIPQPEQSQPQFYKQVEGVILEVNQRKGALIVYTQKDLRGSTINLSFGFYSSNLKADLASCVVARKRNGGTVFVAVFSSLDPANYTVHTDAQEFVTKVSILPGRVEEVDWQ